MAFAPDSTHAGYLGPSPTETWDDLNWENFLQQCVAGITGLPGTLVRPLWQRNPPPTPDLDINWAACGIIRTTANFVPYLDHRSDDGLGYDRLRRQEQVRYRVSFYGPNADDYAAMFRDGLFIEQNRALWRMNAVGLVEAENIDRVPDLFRQQWRERANIELTINREVRRIYKVRNLVRAQALITAEDYSGRILHAEIDTGFVVVDGQISVIEAPDSAAITGDIS